VNLVEATVNRFPERWSESVAAGGLMPAACTPAAAVYRPAAVQLAQIGIAAAAFSFLAGRSLFNGGGKFDADPADVPFSPEPDRPVSELVEHRRSVIRG
jgi:hypothetical protein